MFERYNEKARRTIFFARYEASSVGSPSIETEHLLLGLLRENKLLVTRFLKDESIPGIRREIEEHTPARERVSTSVDLPLSRETKRVLAFGAEEAKQLGDKHVGAEHLLIGMLREENAFAAQLLRERGVTLAMVREDCGHKRREEGPVPVTLHLPPGMYAEIARQAKSRAIDVEACLFSMVDQVLGSEHANRRERYHHLRNRIQNEGVLLLEGLELEREINRRKGRIG